MSNSMYVKTAVDGLNVYIQKFPKKSGNLKYNATRLRNFRLTKLGAEWDYTTSGTIASYAEPVNDGYEQYIFGKKTGKRVPGQFFYEKGAIRLSRFLQGRANNKMFANKMASSAMKANMDANLDSSVRKLVMNRSIELVENGRVQLGEMKSSDIKV